MNIKEASKQSGATPDTIRYYEKIGLIPAVKRNKNGIRLFDEEDIRWLTFARQMRNAGLPIEVLTNYLSLFQQGEQTTPERKQLLADQIKQTEQKIEQMNEALDRLKYKLQNYDDHMFKVEQSLKKFD